MSKKMFFQKKGGYKVEFIPSQIGKVNTIIDSGQGIYMIAGGNQVAILSDLNSQYASVTTAITNVTNLNFTAGVWFNNSFCLISRNGWFFRFDSSCNELNRVSFGTELLNDILVNGNELILLRHSSVLDMHKFYKSLDGVTFLNQNVSNVTRMLGQTMSIMNNGVIVVSASGNYSSSVNEISSNYVHNLGYENRSILFKHTNGDLPNPLTTTANTNGTSTSVLAWFTKFGGVNGTWVIGPNNFGTSSLFSLINATSKLKSNLVVFFTNTGTWITDYTYSYFEQIDTTPVLYLDDFTNKRAVYTNKATYLANNQTIIKVG